MLFVSRSTRETGTSVRPPARRVGSAVVLVAVACALTLGASAGQAAPPGNDNFASAEQIDGESGVRTATNVDATVEPGEPTFGGELGRSVWYRWTAPASSQFIFETCNSGLGPATTFDTMVIVYTGTAVGALRAVAGNDDACNGELSRVAFQAAAGTTYHVAVAGYESASGSFTLSWRRLAAPANDQFAAAQPLTGVSGTISATTLGATLEPGEPSHGEDSGASIWYTWTAPVTARVAFETCGSTFDTLLSVYTGDALSALRRVAQNDDGCRLASRVPVDARAGVTYRIAVAGFEGEQGDLTLTWLRRPANDEVERATTIRRSNGALSGSTRGATRQPGEPSSHKGASVWFRWRAPSATPVAFSTCTASFDTYLFLYRQVGSKRILVRSNDDTCGAGRLGSLVAVFPDPGATYYIALDGLRGATGSFRLTWGRPPASAWCVVPDVRGKKLAVARTMLNASYCGVGRVSSVRSGIVPRGLVMSQFPLPGSTRRPFGTRVNLEVSRGPS